MDMREVFCGDSSDLVCYLVVKDVVSFLPQVVAIFVVSFFVFLGLLWLFEPQPQILGDTLRRHSAGTTSFSLPCLLPAFESARMQHTVTYPD